MTADRAVVDKGSGMDVWRAIEQERLALADDLAGIPDAQWDAQSLCAEWKVREVVAHLNTGATMKTGEAVGGLLRSGFNFNKFMARDGQAKGKASPAELLATLKDSAGSRKTPPMTKPDDVLNDLVCHAQDIRRPLGLHRTFPPETLTACAEKLKDYGFPVGAKKRIAGLRLEATDSTWTHGEGPVVQGPLEALVMAMAGRRAGLDDLSGPGLETLRSRMP